MVTFAIYLRRYQILLYPDNRILSIALIDINCQYANRKVEELGMMEIPNRANFKKRQLQEKS